MASLSCPWLTWRGDASTDHPEEPSRCERCHILLLASSLLPLGFSSPLPGIILIQISSKFKNPFLLTITPHPLVLAPYLQHKASALHLTP